MKDTPQNSLLKITIMAVPNTMYRKYIKIVRMPDDFGFRIVPVVTRTGSKAGLLKSTGCNEEKHNGSGSKYKITHLTRQKVI